MSNRREFLVDAALTVAGLAAASAAASVPPPPASPKKPNIILFLADDMGYSDLGCQGSEIDTPNLDKLAKGGLQLSSFYNSPRCCPSRASLMTGLYSHQAHMGMMVDDHGRYPFPSYDGDLNTNCVTIAEALKPAGYHTYHSGKWHMAAQQTTEAGADKHNWPLQRGFDHGYSMITGAGSYFAPNTLTQDNEPINSFPKDFYFTDAIGEQSVRMIGDTPAGEPFFLYCAFNAPHWPLHAPEHVTAKYRDRYLAGWDEMRKQRHARQIKSGLLKAEWALTPRDPRVPAWERASFKHWEAERMAVYAAQVEILDQNVGKIVAKLQAMGQLENTLIFFMADNGGNYEEFERRVVGKKHAVWLPDTAPDGSALLMGNVPDVMPGPANTIQSYGGPWGNVSNTPFRLYKHYAHEGGISTPLIVHWPQGFTGNGEVVHQVGHEFDIMPTCLAAAGATLPTRSKAGTAPLPLEGRNLLPAFRGKSLAERGMIFWEHEGNCAARDGKWKLVSSWPNTWELYDMDADRTELHNLADAEPERVNQMAEAYRVWAKRVGAQPWPMPQTPVNERGGLPLPEYLKIDRE
ncbi:MAG TPA: arylsulfatase [Acidobacteriaceae bacterium]|jgi:arylsulfatase